MKIELIAASHRVTQGSLPWYRRLFAVVVIGCVLLIAPTPALAQDSEAQLHYELGSRLYQDGLYSDALEHFLASQRIAPTGNLASNIAQIYSLLERPADAYNWYEVALTEFALDDVARQRSLNARDALNESVAVLEVRTIPPGAELFVDRTDLGAIGRSPRRIATTAGNHRIVARLRNHHETTMEVEASLGQIETIELNLTPILGRLIVESEPAGATVLASGRELGRTPLSLELPAGRLELTLSLEGYPEQTREITISPDSEERLAVALSRSLASVAILSLEAEPAGAQVLLGGRDLGRSPVSLGDIEPGRYQLEVRAEGHVPWSEEIILEPGSATRGTVSLVSQERLTRLRILQWLGYGLSGATLAVGVVCGALALTHREAFFAAENPTRDELDRVDNEGLAADVLIITGATSLAVTLIVDILMRRRLRSRGTVTIDR